MCAQLNERYICYQIYCSLLETKLISPTGGNKLPNIKIDGTNLSLSSIYL